MVVQRLGGSQALSPGIAPSTVDNRHGQGRAWAGPRPPDARQAPPSLRTFAANPTAAAPRNRCFGLPYELPMRLGTPQPPVTLAHGRHANTQAPQTFSFRVSDRLHRGTITTSHDKPRLTVRERPEDGLLKGTWSPPRPVSGVLPERTIRDFCKGSADVGRRSARSESGPNANRPACGASGVLSLFHTVRAVSGASGVFASGHFAPVQDVPPGGRRLPLMRRRRDACPASRPKRRRKALARAGLTRALRRPARRAGRTPIIPLAEQAGY